MFDKYRGIILTLILIASFAYMGYKNEQNVANSVKQILHEEKHSLSSTKLDSPSDITTPSTPEAVESQNLSASQVEEIVKSYIARNPHITTSSIPEAVESQNLSASQVEEIVKSYIARNPEIIADALQKLQQMQNEQMRQNAQKIIDKNKSRIINSLSPVIGTENATSTIVMFYDYNCGYCKKSYDIIQSIMNNDHNIKLILKIYPVLGEDSEFLARLMTGVHINEPSKFVGLHKQLLSEKLFNKEDLVELFRDHNLDFEKYESLAHSEQVEKILKDNIALGRDLKINGVPTFIINDNYYPGFLNEELLTQALKSTNPVDPALNQDSTDIEPDEEKKSPENNDQESTVKK